MDEGDTNENEPSAQVKHQNLWGSGPFLTGARSKIYTPCQQILIDLMSSQSFIASQ